VAVGKLASDRRERFLIHPAPLYECTDLAHYAPPVTSRSFKTLPLGGGAPHRLGIHSKATGMW
jgi:hypothetical protein